MVFYQSVLSRRESNSPNFKGSALACCFHVENLFLKLRILIISLKGNSGSDRYYEVLNKALQEFTALESDLIFFPSFIEFFPFLIPYYLKRINHSGYGILHTNSEYGHLFATRNKILVNTIHHNIFEARYKNYTSIPQKIYHRIWIKANLRKSLNIADATIAVSKYTKESIVKTFGRHHDKIHVVYNGIDTERFRRESLGKKNCEKARLLFVGNANRRKGFDLLPAIMEKLGSKYELYFTTGLRNTKSIEKKYHLTGNMIPLLKISTEKLVKEYNKCDALIFPSRLEGFGYCVAEALCCGKPVITTNCSAMPELIENGHNGFLCNMDDVDDFVEKIKMYRQVKSQRIAEESQEKFNLRNYAQQMEKLYIEIFNQQTRNIKL